MSQNSKNDLRNVLVGFWAEKNVNCIAPQNSDPDVVVPRGDPERREAVLVQPRVEHAVPLVVKEGVHALEVVEAGEVVEDGARRGRDGVLRLGVEVVGVVLRERGGFWNCGIPYGEISLLP